MWTVFRLLTSVLILLSTDAPVCLRMRASGVSLGGVTILFLVVDLLATWAPPFPACSVTRLAVTWPTPSRCVLPLRLTRTVVPSGFCCP